MIRTSAVAPTRPTASTPHSAKYAAPQRLTTATGVTALTLSAVALTVTVHAASPPTAPPAPPVSAPGTGDPLPAAVLATLPPSPQATQPSPDPLQTWARQRAPTYDIPERALYAYGYATAELQAAQPNCHLGWPTLAAVGSVESNHARYGGATISPAGLVTPPIRGVPLDGTHGNEQITTATRGGTSYVRAQGPFQFLPDTWSRWGITASVPAQPLSAALASGTRLSGSADGNPDNIDDAALTAARYLCADNHDLATPTGWTAAILAYNHSTSYLNQIHTAAIRYSTGRT